jgi:hypothetical protein
MVFGSSDLNINASSQLNHNSNLFEEEKKDDSNIRGPPPMFEYKSSEDKPKAKGMNNAD